MTKMSYDCNKANCKYHGWLAALSMNKKLG